MPSYCSIPDCATRVKGAGLCEKHYERLKKHGDPLYVRTPRTCDIPNCGKPHKGRGLCEVHLDRLTMHGDALYERPTVTQRFWAKVDKTPGGAACWEWQGARAQHGYGIFDARSGERFAHRRSWVMANGPIPDGLCVLHRCDNPPCVNPRHLFLGTKSDNTADMMNKGRHRPVSMPRESNPNVKLTEAQMLEIRQRYVTESISQDRLAREYGISQTQVSRIIRYESWPD